MHKLTAMLTAMLTTCITECMMQVLHFVIDKKHYEIVPFLLARMTNEAEKAQSVRHTSAVNQPSSKHLAPVLCSPVCVVQTGVGSVVNINHLDNKGFSALHVAVAKVRSAVMLFPR